MNVSSLSPWLSDFHTIRFSVSSGCFLFLNCYPSFGWARRHSVFTYTSILAGSSWNISLCVTFSEPLEKCYSFFLISSHHLKEMQKVFLHKMECSFIKLGWNKAKFWEGNLNFEVCVIQRKCGPCMIQRKCGPMNQLRFCPQCSFSLLNYMFFPHVEFQTR